MSSGAPHQVTFQQLIGRAYGSTADLVPYPVGFLKAFKRHWIQNCIFVPESQLEQIGYHPADSDSHANGSDFAVDANKLTSLIEAFLETRPPLCPVMEEIAFRQGAAGIGATGAAAGPSNAPAAAVLAAIDGPSSASSAAGGNNKNPSAMAAVRKAKIALRHLGIAYEELCKLTSQVNKETMLKAGLSEEVSTRIATAIYMTKRETMGNDVDILTPRSEAVAALRRFDRNVSFRACRLCPDDLGAYLPHIVHNTELTALDLSYNNIHHRGAKALAATLSGLPNLVSLSVAGNNLQFEGLQVVIKSLARRNHFHFLDISANNGGVRTGLALGNDLKVRHLAASANHITADGIMALIPSARTAHKLVLASNNFGICDGNASCLSDVDTNTNNKKGGGAAKALVTLLSACDYLTHVDISNNNLSSQASDIILAEAIARHPALTSMELSLNAFDVKAVTEVVLASPQLTSVSCGSNASTVRDAVAHNQQKMLEFRAFLTELGLPNWTNDNVRDALTFLLKRRDIAMQTPVDGSLLMVIKALDSDAGNSLGSFGYGASDFGVLCDFLDTFRADKGEVVVQQA